MILKEIIEKRLIWKTELNNWCRKCPKCKNIIESKSGKNYVIQSIKKNRTCHFCKRIGMHHSKITIEKIIKSQKGRPLTDEHKEKLSISARKNKNHPWRNHKRPKWFGKLISKRLQGRIISSEWKCKIGLKNKGKKKHTDKSKKEISLSSIKMWKNPQKRKYIIKCIKLALHRPDIRKKYIESMFKTPWLKTKMDSGQLELIEKWNRLGFNFEINYQVTNNIDFLAYLDGYDKEHNVALEYDSKYHNCSYQKKKDLVRQQKIINILKPKKFWRYDLVNKLWNNVLENTVNK